MNEIPTDLDKPITLEQAAEWLGVSVRWLRLRLNSLPGIIVESRETVLFHRRTYLETRLKKFRK